MTRRAFFAFMTLALLAAGNSFAQENQTQEKQTTEKQTMISGVVQGADAKPLAKARVYLQPSDGRAPHTMLTDADGRYQFTKLKPGLYDLRAQSNGKWTDLQRNVNVHANEEVTVNLSFSPPAKP